MLQDNKVMWRYGHNANDWFFTSQEKKISMLSKTETTIFIHDSKSFHTTQTTISLIHSEQWYKHAMNNQHEQLLFDSQLKHYAYYLQSTTSTTNLILLCKNFVKINFYCVKIKQLKQPFFQFKTRMFWNKR